MKKTVLIVDDDALLLEIIGYVFSKSEFKMLQAVDGQNALKILDEHEQSIDLIITDYNMPGINGLELARAVKIQPKYQNTPLILVTANPEITLILGKHREIFNEVIPKPFSPQFILSKVATLLA